MVESISKSTIWLRFDVQYRLRDCRLMVILHLCDAVDVALKRYTSHHELGRLIVNWYCLLQMQQFT